MSEQKWSDWVWANADRLRMGTEAHHSLGDISRENPDALIVRETHPDCYIGEWLTGFGFVGVRFPKSTTRPLTVPELHWLAEHPVALS